MGSGVDDSAGGRAHLDTVEGLSAPAGAGPGTDRRADPVALAETVGPSGQRRQSADVGPTCPRSGSRLERALAKARAEEGLLGAAVTKVEIGRFSIAERLGRGAMGVVYAGYDPKLDRRVAIKLVDPSRLGSEAGNAQARLEREARAAADLSHANVVTVYDVGIHDGGVFLAMEHVEGTTLNRWLQAEIRPWREVLAMFVQIGHGLAAAHDAGIVHRDFKPENVLVGDDGRPRIADFGLARPIEGWSARESQPSRSSARGRSVSSVLATTGEVCGTPAYMAPEQFCGADVGPASDQFGFCVSLFEALFGFRPFKGSSITALASRVIEGQVEPLPPNHRVPRHLVALIERGLLPAPEDRHESVAALVARLEDVAHRRRRRVMLAGATGLAAVALAGGYQVSAAQQIDPCEAIDGPIEAVWTAASREAVRAAVAETPVLESVEQYVSDWRVERRQACEATRVYGEQSDFALELRMACLDQAAARMDGIVAELADPDQTLRRPEQLVSLLRPLEECRDVEQLERVDDRLRRGTLTPAEIEAQREGTELIARAEARKTAGRPGAEALLEEALELFEDADYRAMQGVVHVKLATSAIDAGDLAAAAVHLDSASTDALVTGHDDAAADAALLASWVALEQGRPEVAELHLKYGEGLVERVADDSMRQLMRGTVGFRRAALLEHRGFPQEALRVLEEALEILTEHPRASAQHVASAYALAGSIAVDLADVQRAVQAHETALAYLERANIHGLDEAYQRANLAASLRRMHRFEDAAHHFEQAQAIMGRLYGDDHIGVALMLTSRGRLAREAGDLEAARPLFERALTIFQRATPDGHPNWATALDNLADIDRREGKYDDALVRLDRARAIRVQLYGKDDAGLGYTQTIRGRVYADMGQLDRAAEQLSQALEIFRRPGASPSDLAEAEVAMARAVRDSDPARSEALIAAARRRMPTNVPFPVRYAEDLDKLEAASGQ